MAIATRITLSSSLEWARVPVIILLTATDAGCVDTETAEDKYTATRGSVTIDQWSWYILRVEKQGVAQSTGCLACCSGSVVLADLLYLGLVLNHQYVNGHFRRLISKRVCTCNWFLILVYKHWITPGSLHRIETHRRVHDQPCLLIFFLHRIRQEDQPLLCNYCREWAPCTRKSLYEHIYRTKLVAVSYK